MDSQIYGRCFFFVLALVLSAAAATVTLPSNKSSSAAVNSNSVLVALLDSHYIELAELVEKALLLQSLEEAVGNHNVTIFAPKNEALERQLDPEFKRFLLEPSNLKSLQYVSNIAFSPTHVGWRGKSDGDGISLFGARKIWINHCSLSFCADCSSHPPNHSTHPQRQ